MAGITSRVRESRSTPWCTPSSAGNSPEAIQQSFPLLKLAQIYGAIAFYLDHQAEIQQYLKNEERRIQESTVPLSEANPELWNRLQRGREELRKSGS